MENILKLSPHVDLLQMSKNGPHIAKDLFSEQVLMNLSFSICVTDNLSVIHLWNEGGDEDFHSLNISVMAANTHKISEFSY